MSKEALCLSNDIFKRHSLAGSVAPLAGLLKLETYMGHPVNIKGIACCPKILLHACLIAEAARTWTRKRCMVRRPSSEKPRSKASATGGVVTRLLILLENHQQNEQLIFLPSRKTRTRLDVPYSPVGQGGGISS